MAVVALLVAVLAVVLVLGLAWVVRSDGFVVSSLADRLADVEQTVRVIDRDLDSVASDVSLGRDALFAHECKPSTAAHSRPVAKKAAAPAKAQPRPRPGKSAPR